MDVFPSLFEQQTPFFELINSFQKKILISSKDIESNFIQFNKKYTGKFQISFFSSLETTEDLFLFERNCFKKNIITDCGNFTIEVKVVQDVAIDIEPFFDEISDIFINRMYEPDFIHPIGAEDGSFGYWVVDEKDNILLINEIGKKVYSSIKGSTYGLNPRACILDNDVYLIIPKNKNGYTYYVAYIINEETLFMLANNLLKELTLESSILAHEIRNALTGIKFGLEIIREENAEAREIANELMVSVDRCFGVVQTFLSFNKELKDKTPVYLDLVAQDVKKFLGPRANDLLLRFSSENIKLNVKNESLLFLTLYLLFSEIILVFKRMKNVNTLSEDLLELGIYTRENKNIVLSCNSVFKPTGIFEKNIYQYLLLKSLFSLNGLNFKSSGLHYILEDNC